MSSPVEELIREIAARHGIAVGRDDPILVLHTIHTRLLEDSARAQQTLLDQYKAEMEALAGRWGRDANAKAEKILNAALTASKEAMARRLEEGAQEATRSLQREIDAALAPVRVAIREGRRIGQLNVVAACLTFLAAAVTLWAAFH